MQCHPSSHLHTCYPMENQLVFMGLLGFKPSQQAAAAGGPTRCHRILKRRNDKAWKMSDKGLCDLV